jgi:hypothetical protein
MAILLRALSVLPLLPAAAGAGAPASGEAALEQASIECTAAMRVDLLQKSVGARAAAMMMGGSNVSFAHGKRSGVKSLSLSKSTFALSDIHVGKSAAFKRFFLPVESEWEATGFERPEFLHLVEDAIVHGAALADKSEYYSQAFDPVAFKEDCGKASRFRLKTVLGEPYDEPTRTFGGMSQLSFHGVYARGYGTHGSSHREVGGLKVRYVERIFQEELDGLKEYSPWMDIHAGIYDNDLDSYVQRFFDHDVPVLALKWPSADEEHPSFFYSLIVHVPDTQEVFEIISATAPSHPKLVLKEFPMARHVFELDELGLLMGSWGPTQLHISRSHYDLDAVKAHYKTFFQMEPVHELRDADTGVSFVSFWHQSISDSDVDAIRVQVMYWNRPDQSTTVGHTTAWLERRLEELNSQYMQSYMSCWPIWGDNHYTITEASGDYFERVRQKYDNAGIGYMLFNDGSKLMTGYFPLPGGMYMELQPVSGSQAAVKGARDWISPEADGELSGGALYCWTFTCPS